MTECRRSCSFGQTLNTASCVCGKSKIPHLISVGGWVGGCGCVWERESVCVCVCVCECVGKACEVLVKGEVGGRAHVTRAMLLCKLSSPPASQCEVNL